MTATIHSIHIASNRGDEQNEMANARLTVAVGLEGDRHANTGIVTLIELEEILAFNAHTGLEITPGEARRNLVTQGIGLNNLVGKQFRIGEILLEGAELCEPCATLGNRLSTDRVTATQVVKAFTHAAGIRAFVRGTGEITPGATIAES